MRIAAGVEYDGSGFAGWQVQREGRTVQACVEQALGRVADHPVQVVCAGRTDAGVHATGQVIHFDTEAARSDRSWVLGANTHLPGDVCLTWARPVPEDFHARFSARARRYRYVILDRWVRPALLRGRATWCHYPLDVERMQMATRHLLGEHDFSTFRALGCQAKSPVRTIHEIAVTREGEFVYLDVRANAFLHHMVRNIAGVLLAVGKGEQAPDWVPELLAHRDRTKGGVTAPPDGLYFVQVYYESQFDVPTGGTPLHVPVLDR